MELCSYGGGRGPGRHLLAGRCHGPAQPVREILPHPRKPETVSSRLLCKRAGIGGGMNSLRVRHDVHQDGHQRLPESCRVRCRPHSVTKKKRAPTKRPLCPISSPRLPRAAGFLRVWLSPLVNIQYITRLAHDRTHASGPLRISMHIKLTNGTFGDPTVLPGRPRLRIGFKGFITISRNPARDQDRRTCNFQPKPTTIQCV